MKECPELLTAEEYNEICSEMLEFQEANNRLSYDEDGSESPATVEDKSFSLVDSDENPVLRQKPSVIESVKGLFLN
jgi:hypothetical protein